MNGVALTDHFCCSVSATVAVTESGWEGFGDNCRSWNVAQV